MFPGAITDLKERSVAKSSSFVEAGHRLVVDDHDEVTAKVKKWKQRWKKNSSIPEKEDPAAKEAKVTKSEEEQKIFQKTFSCFCSIHWLCSVVLQNSSSMLSCVTTCFFYAYLCFRTTLICLVMLQYSFQSVVVLQHGNVIGVAALSIKHSFGSNS